MKLWFKKLTVPENSATKEVEAVQLWYVKWTKINSFQQAFLSGTKVMEAFTSKEAADEFAESLKKANKLLRDDWRDITVEKN